MNKDYEMVIGLEVHVELKTAAKIFCSCSTAFGAEPNTQCCPVCMGMPGTLPVLNREVVRHAVKAGLATNCTIADFSKQDRKNYFYPDLPKAYQISQYDLPLCQHGYLDIETDGQSKRIGITRIHIEEDAGKLVHTGEGGTLCDYNRCGVPLIEIVSEPDIRSAAEARAYLQKLRAIMMYIGVSDCKMQEGSLRCDVNLSVRKKGETKFGTRTEMKNLNSFQFIAKAIEFEFDRQVKAIEAGETIIQETRRFDQTAGKTFSMRRKENANDYRYFPDPDLAPIVIGKELLKELKNSIPQLPDERKREYMDRYGLSSYDAEMLVNDKDIADYFQEAAGICHSPKMLANLITSEIFRLLPPEETQIPINSSHLAKTADLLAQERINSSMGKKLIQMMWNEDSDPEALADANKMWQISDRTVLRPILEKVVRDNPKEVEEYKGGREKVLQMLIGQSMRATNGQGNPVMIQEILLELMK